MERPWKGRVPFQIFIGVIPRILDYIRNYREIPEDMLHKIAFMTEEKKMTIIREFIPVKI
jgi:hypothetical protein